MKPATLVILCVALAPLLPGNPNVRVDPGGVPATGTIGKSYSGRVTASQGRTPYVFSLASGSLPNGLSLSSDGNISGTPTVIGVFSFSVRVTDRDGDSATGGFAITIIPAPPAPLSVTTTSPLPNGTVGSAYAQGLDASGGSPPYQWSGSAPAGLSLASNGLITGTPTTAGSFTFTATVTDDASRTASRSFRITINQAPLTITTTSPLSRGVFGAPYSQTLAAAGGVPPYRWSGSAPAGLTLSTGGVISGVPSAAGNFNFTATVTDSNSTTASRNFAIAIDAPALTITTDALPGGSIGTLYSQQLSATGGVPPLTWSIIAGQAPGGITLGVSSGVLGGTPSTGGTFNFTVQVRDSSGLTTSKPFSITVDQGQPQPLTISTASTLPGGTVGAAYAQTLAAAGGSPPYVWSITSGLLPAGLGFDAARGLLSGTPAAVGSSSFTVQVRDSRGAVVTRQLTITVVRNFAITTATLPNTVLGTAYNVMLSADGGVPPYNWAIASGSLPIGLSLDAATGRLSGNPSGAGQFSFVVRVSDSTGASASTSYSLTVDAPAVPALSLTSVPDVASAAQQLILDLNLASGYPFPITGQVTINFVPDPAVGSDDPAVQFSTGGRSVSFTISANATQPASPIALQTGSVAGTIELQVTAPGAGAGLSRSIRVSRSAPTIRNLTVVRNATGFELRLVGLSTLRALTQATVRFTGTGLLTSDVSIPLSDVASGWYKSAASSPFGSQFSLVLPFTVQGDSNAIQSATLTVSNSEGASAPLTAAFSGR